MANNLLEDEFTYADEAPADSEFSYADEPSENKLQPSSAERKMSQFSMNMLAGARSTPRMLLETPGFLADVADIVAERIQQPLDQSKVPGAIEGPSLIQRMFPGAFTNERKPQEDIYKPGTALRNLIPESVQDKYQQLKESDIGGVKVAPTFQESQDLLKEQFKDPNSFLRKTLPEMFGEESLPSAFDAAQIDDLMTPKDTWEKYQERALEFGVPGALLGGATSSVAGAGLGLGDKYLEERGVSEDDRKLMAVIFAPLLHEGIGKTGNVLKEVGRISKSPKISSATDLTVKMLAPRMKNIDLDQIRIAQKEGINPTLASITKGGMSQFGANMLSQNFIAKGMFDTSVNQMTGDIVNAIDKKINTMSPQKFFDLSEATTQEIGHAPFTNPVKKLGESFSDDNLSNFEIGDQVQTRLQEIMEDEKAASNKLYNDVKKHPSIEQEFVPIQAHLETQSMLKEKKPKANLSQETGSLVNKLEAINKIFIGKKVKLAEPGLIQKLILPEEMIKEIETKRAGGKLAKPKLTYREAINLVEELGRVIDFEHTFGNQTKALIPIRNALIRDIETSMRTSGLGDLFDKWTAAKKNYIEYADTFGRNNPPVYKALYSNTPENIASSANKRSGMQGFLRAFSKSNKAEQAYFNLQKGALRNIVGPEAMEASDIGKFKVSKAKAQRLQELKPILQMDAQVLVDDINSLVDRIGKGIKDEQRRDAIRADILNSLAQGELPIQTLQMMNTPSGIRLVQDTLSTTPKGKKFLDSLSREKARELIMNKSMGNDGSVSLTKMNSNIKNNKKQLSMLMDKKAFAELKDIGSFIDKAIKGDRAFRNFSQTETMRQNAGLIKKIYSFGRIMASGMFGKAILGSAETAALFGAAYALAKLYTNPKFIDAVSKMAEKAAKNAPNERGLSSYISSIDNVLKVAKEELSPEDYKELQKFNRSE